MSSTTTALPIDLAPAGEQTAVGRQIRGSSLLLVGRLVAKGVNFGAQVLVVRYLSQSDYGALAYALSIVTLGEGLAKFGLCQTITRFLPIYDQRKQYDKLFGTVVMASGTVLSIGLAIALLVCAAQGLLARSLISDQRALSLLLMLIFLVPIQAIDYLLLGMFAVFASPRSIFFRRHVLGPGLKLLVVLLLIAGHGSVFFLAGGYVLAATVGVAVCCVTIYRLLKRNGLFEHFQLRSMSVPWREILWFAVPLLASDFIHLSMHTVSVIVLQYYGDFHEVAMLRAVQPLALMNQLVMASFATLFTPMAARMFARGDHRGINHLYWQTAVWIAVFSFPVFAVTFSLAKPVTVLLYGARYEQSAVILSLLSLGCYFNAALGLNGLTLKVYGRVRYMVAVNLAVAMLTLGVVLWLVPRYGAMGAAIGTAATLIAHNVLKHVGLRFGTGVKLFERQYAKVYLTIVLGAAALWVVQAAMSPPAPVSLAMAALVSLAVLRLNRRALNAEEVFPELLRLPLARQLLGR